MRPLTILSGAVSYTHLDVYKRQAQACQLALTARAADGMAFNITNGEPMEFKTLLEHFLAAIGEKPHYRKLPFGAVYGMAAAMEWVYRSFHFPEMCIRDRFYKWLVEAAVCLHWFNPAVYVLQKEVSRTCELSCDCLLYTSYWVWRSCLRMIS